MPKSIELEKRVRSSPQRRSHLVVLTLRNLSPNRSQKRPIYHLNCESQASAADFLLLKIYEAAKQLEASSGRRTAVVIINDYLAWPIFDFVLSHQWIDWNSPRLTSTDAEWQTFLDDFKKRYPQVETDLAKVLATLHEVKILRLTHGFVLS